MCNEGMKVQRNKLLETMTLACKQCCGAEFTHLSSGFERLKDETELSELRKRQLDQTAQCFVCRKAQ